MTFLQDGSCLRKKQHVLSYPLSCHACYWFFHWFPGFLFQFWARNSHDISTLTWDPYAMVVCLRIKLTFFLYLTLGFVTTLKDLPFLLWASWRFCAFWFGLQNSDQLVLWVSVWRRFRLIRSRTFWKYCTCLVWQWQRLCNRSFIHAFSVLHISRQSSAFLSVLSSGQRFLRRASQGRASCLHSIRNLDTEVF